MRFHHLTRIREFRRGRFLVWECACDCGVVKVFRRSHVLDGRTKSCGCFRKSRTPLKTHGWTGTATYRTWMSMQARCRNKADPKYGGRGIAVCGRWSKFENFLADMGHRPNGTSLDRINNDGNYEPGNCRWATVAQQADNKRSSVRVTVNGVSRSLKAWSRMTGLNYKALHSAMQRGCDVAQRIEQSVMDRS